MRVPSYYLQFKCIADQCRHSCCVGWEIDVDERTLARYRALSGEMGDKIAASIEENEDGAHFRLGEGERCPHLAENGLCRIITALGEGYLCDICREHPRFYHECGGVWECGLGLACEEAARLVLDTENYDKFVEIEDGDDYVIVKREGPLTHTNIKTMPYPGFPTDMQPQISAALSCAGGVSIVTESVWDNRFKYVDELRKMGAQIQVQDRTALIQGVDHLTGSTVKACDLRAGAAIVIAGLAAQGETKVEDIQYIERGYQNIVGKLQALGADIRCIDEPDEPDAMPGWISA